MRLSAEAEAGLLLIKARIWQSSSLREEEDLYASSLEEDEEDGRGKKDEEDSKGEKDEEVKAEEEAAHSQCVARRALSAHRANVDAAKIRRKKFQLQKATTKS